MSDQYPPPPSDPTGPDPMPPAAGGPGTNPPPPPPVGAPGTGSPAAPPPPTYGSAPAPEPYQAPAQNPYGAPQPAPAYGAPPPAGPVTRPRSIDLAVLLMRVGAALSVLSLASVFFLGDQIREQARKSLEDSGQTVDPSLVDAAVAIGIGVGVISGLVGAGLWLFMAWANGKGKSWARVVASVLFGLSLLFSLVSLAQPSAGISRVLNLVSLVLGGYIVFLLWRKESSDFYAASSAPRY